MEDAYEGDLESGDGAGAATRKDTTARKSTIGIFIGSGIDNLNWLLSRSLFVILVVTMSVVLDKPIREAIKGDIVSHIEEEEEKKIVSRYNYLDELNVAIHLSARRLADAVEQVAAESQSVFSVYSVSDEIDRFTLATRALEGTLERRVDGFPPKLESSIYSFLRSQQEAQQLLSAYCTRPTDTTLRQLKASVILSNNYSRIIQDGIRDYQLLVLNQARRQEYDAARK